MAVSSNWSGEVMISDWQQAFNKLLIYLSQNIDRDHDTEMLAQAAGANPLELTSYFYEQFDLSPGEWLQLLKVVIIAEGLVKSPAASCEDLDSLIGPGCSENLRPLFERVFGPEARFREHASQLKALERGERFHNRQPLPLSSFKHELFARALDKMSYMRSRQCH